MEITGNPEPKGSRGPRASATPRCVLASSWEEIPLEKDQTISVGCLAQQPRRGALLLWSLHLRKITTVILWKETEVPRCFHYCFFLKEERSRVLILKAPQLFRAFGLAALTKSQGSLVSPFILIKVELKKKKTPLPVSQSISVTVKNFTFSLRAAEGLSSISCLCEFHVSYLVAHASTAAPVREGGSGLILSSGQTISVLTPVSVLPRQPRGTAGGSVFWISPLREINVLLITLTNSQSIPWVIMLRKHWLHWDGSKYVTLKTFWKKVSLYLVNMFKQNPKFRKLKRFLCSYLLGNWNVCCMPSFSISLITCVCSYMLTFIVAKLMGINTLVDRKGNNTDPSVSWYF